jgi:hypothetical protein
MRHGPRWPFVLCGLLCCVIGRAPALQAQTVDDGIMLARGDLLVGDLFSYDRWDHYWEGTLDRTNGNIGTLCTRTNLWVADYGVTDRLMIVTSIPYVWTHASEGVLHDMHGLQDITIAAKYSVFEKSTSRHSLLRAMLTAAGGLPLTDYTPDFQPLSIGLGSRRVSGRLTLNYQSNPGLYLNASGGYTWRHHVTLDRPYYYTDDQLTLSDRVPMPSVVDYVVSAGYLHHGLMATVNFTQQRTRGGGDIRRQDMPFVSNRMDFSKVGAMLMVPPPKLRNVRLQLSYGYTLDGRNVGRATTVMAGANYMFHLAGSSTR